MYNFDFDYTIYPNNSTQKFKEACAKIEKQLPKANKADLLIDVDGSVIQSYKENGKNIVVYDDYDVGAVFVKSEISLDSIFS